MKLICTQKKLYFQRQLGSTNPESRVYLKKVELVKLVKRQLSKWPEKSFNASHTRVATLKEALLTCGFSKTVAMPISVGPAPASCELPANQQSGSSNKSPPTVDRANATAESKMNVERLQGDIEHISSMCNSPFLIRPTYRRSWGSRRGHNSTPPTAD